jgi:hypothetical protein
MLEDGGKLSSLFTRIQSSTYAARIFNIHDIQMVKVERPILL